MKYGYCRVSTDEQCTDLQRRALLAAGCVHIYEDCGVTGTRRERPELSRVLQKLGDGDVLVVYRLDRLGRSLPHLIEVVSALSERGAGFESLSETINTETAGGKLIFHIMGALAEFERSLISERTRAGMQAAAARGRTLGRAPKLSAKQIAHARMLVHVKRRTRTSVAAELNVSRATLNRALASANSASPSA